MKSLGSQLIITESGETLRNSVVQLEDYAIFYHSILNNNHESAHTLFYDGILSPLIISLSARGVNTREVEHNGYKIVPIENLENIKSIERGKVIIDFKTENLVTINDLIKKHQHTIYQHNSIDFIISCAVIPRLFIPDFKSLLGKRALWNRTNLLEKKITGQTFVSIV